jgi:hypothetical protein
MNNMKMKRFLYLLDGSVSMLVLLSALLAGQRAGGQTPPNTIAYWRFQSDNPGADSSGNGNDLSLNGAWSFTTDAPTNAPDATNSAVFDGASTSAQTAAALDMSLYPAFTIEWFMKNNRLVSRIYG